MAKKMSLTSEDSEGNKLNAEMEELHELRNEMKILEALKPIRDSQIEMKLTLQRIESKVHIHNNYEKRIRSLEVKIWGVTSIFTGLLAVMGVIYFLLNNN